MGDGWWSKLFRGNTSGAATQRIATVEDGDAVIIAQLKKLGADLEKPREAVHYLYLPSEDASHQTAAALRQDGYDVTVRPAANASSNPPNPWLVLARKITIVNTETVRATRARFTALADQTHGEYDGWEAAAQP